MGYSNETNLRLPPYRQKSAPDFTEGRIAWRTSMGFEGMFSQLIECSVPIPGYPSHLEKECQSTGEK